MDIRPRKNRETSPDRVRRCMQPKPMKALRKVQVLYYLSRNGQLEHPHFMEVSHLANQQLRLKGKLFSQNHPKVQTKRIPINSASFFPFTDASFFLFFFHEWKMSLIGLQFSEAVECPLSSPGLAKGTSFFHFSFMIWISFFCFFPHLGFLTLFFNVLGATRTGMYGTTCLRTTWFILQKELNMFSKGQKS